jgi:hypothetical protein
LPAQLSNDAVYPGIVTRQPHARKNVAIERDDTLSQTLFDQMRRFDLVPAHLHQVPPRSNKRRMNILQRFDPLYPPLS